MLAPQRLNRPGSVDLAGFGYEVVGQVGQDQDMSVRLVRESDTDKILVAKCVSLAALSEHDQELAKQEVYLLQALDHPLVVAYHDSFLIDEDNILVILIEHCGGGDLGTRIRQKANAKQRFSENDIMVWFVQIALALQYIHSEKVLHRDLKTSNIFVMEDSSRTKLGDFGLSRVMEATLDAANTVCGTPYYMSPEVCQGELYSWKSDVWSLGCVLYELCMLRPPFEAPSLVELVRLIVSDAYEPLPPCYSEGLSDLVGQLLSKSAHSRPSVNEIFSNLYVKAYVEALEPAS
jgi:NIMA (never in mitosis gene a)-related kinase